jgi:hypothetical protein
MPSKSFPVQPTLAGTGLLEICIYNVLFFYALTLVPAAEAGLIKMIIPARGRLTSVACWKLFYGLMGGTMEHVCCSCPGPA